MASKRNRAAGGAGRDRRLGTLAGSQDGVVSLDQLRGIEVTPRAAAYRAEQGSLHRVHRATYAVGHRSLGVAGTLRAALLACGEDAVVSHGTAAALWGLRDKWPTLIDVTVPGQRGRKIDGVRCRRCRYPAPHEIDLEQGVRCTTPARTMVDLGGLLGTPSQRRLVERAAVLGLLRLDALDLALYEASGRRGVKSMRRIADEWRTEDGSVPDVRSDFEALVLPRLMAMGIPRPACNQALHLGEESPVVDFLWPERRLVVETDGRQTHETPVAFQRDRRRDQVLVGGGYRVARVTWHQIQREREEVVARIAGALQALP